MFHVSYFILKSLTQVPTSNPADTDNSGLCKGIAQPVNDRAIAFFLSTHIFRDSGPVRGYYEYLPIFHHDPRTDKRLSTALTAVALAAYAHAFRYPDLLNEARNYFGSALHLVNTALSSHKEATKDSTIISIMLLSTFAALTCRSQQSLLDCGTHMDGIITVTKLRGHRSLESRNGLQLFLHLFSIIIHSCIYHSVQVPEELIKLHNYADTFLDMDNPAWKLLRILIKLAEFRANIRDHILCDNLAVIEAATRIDLELSLLGDQMPVQWQFTTVFMKEKSELVFGSYYHVYPDLWVAHIWNTLRTSRLLLNEEIRKQLEGMPSFPRVHSPIKAINNQILTNARQQITLDICATIPQYSGHLSMLLSSPTQAQRSILPENVRFPSLFANDDIPLPAAVYFFLCPLLLAGHMADSDIQRDWISHSSRLLGQITGIQQAFGIAHVVKGSQNISVSL